MNHQLYAFLLFLQTNIWHPEKERLVHNLQALKQIEEFAYLLGEAESKLEELTEQELNRQYSAVFEYTNADILIPVWESAYADNRRILIDETTLAVIREYYARGLTPDDAGQPADYVGYEVDYLLYLLGTAKDFDKAVEFFEVHTLSLLKGIAETILSTDGTGQYYRVLSEIILQYAKIWKDERNRNWRTDYGEEALPLHFQSISPEQAKEELKENIICTAGRSNCGSKCSIRAYVTAGCITHLESDISDSDSFTVKACVRGRGYRKTFLGTDRLRYPMLRIGERGEGKFKRISWDEALTIIENKLNEITEKYGPGSRYIQYSSGVSTTVRGDAVMKRLLAQSGGYLDKYNSYSSACSGIAVPYTYGTLDTNSTSVSYKKTKLLILWGGNPAVTLYNYRVFDYLKYLKEHNVPIIVIDPQYSDTAAVFATQWIPIRPGTDSALASAMAYVILDKNLQDQRFMDTYCIGFDHEHMPEGCEEQETFRDYIFGVRDGVKKTPEWASEITGIPADVIADLAVRYATAKPAAIVPGLGLQRHSNGEQSVRSITVLPSLTGNVGKEGGSTGARGTLVQHATPKLELPDNPYGASIPSFLWTDAIIRGTEMTEKRDHVRGREKLDSNIKLIFNLAGNTLINQHSDINRTVKILKDTSLCEFIVVSDLFMTPSARFADLLLPGTSLFENDAMTGPWSEGDYLLYSNTVIPPMFESRFEFDWITELGRRMGAENLADGCSNLKDWLKLLYQRLQEKEPELPPFEEFTKHGGYKYKKNKIHIAFKEQIEDPQNHPFPTKSGKIEIFSKDLLAFDDPENIPAIPKYVPAFEGIGDERQKDYPLQLIGWHTKRRCHSVHDNNEWMEEVEPHRVWIHPEDAKPRGITEDSLVQVYNDRGTVEIKAHLSHRIMKGVLCIPQGAWYSPDERGIDVRGSINSLTIARPTPLAKGNPQHSNLVEIRRVSPMKSGRTEDGNDDPST